MRNKIKKIELGNFMVALFLSLPNLAFAQESKSVIEIGLTESIIIIIATTIIAGIAWGTLKTDVGHIKTDIKPIGNIKNSIIEIQTIFGQKGIVLKYNLSEAPGSPLMPTQSGAQDLETFKILEVLDTNKAVLIEKLKAKLQLNYTEYDIQETARELMVELIDDPIMNPVKKYAYDNGITSNVIKIYLKTAGLLLRDDFLGLPRRIKK